MANSDATKRKPVLSTHIAVAGGTVSKYFSLISVTTSSSVSKVICGGQTHTQINYTPTDITKGNAYTKNSSIYKWFEIIIIEVEFVI